MATRAIDRLRSANTLQKVPYLLVIGDREGAGHGRGAYACGARSRADASRGFCGALANGALTWAPSRRELAGRTARVRLAVCCLADYGGTTLHFTCRRVRHCGRLCPAAAVVTERCAAATHTLVAECAVRAIAAIGICSRRVEAPAAMIFAVPRPPIDVGAARAVPGHAGFWRVGCCAGGNRGGLAAPRPDDLHPGRQGNSACCCGHRADLRSTRYRATPKPEHSALRAAAYGVAPRSRRRREVITRFTALNVRSNRRRRVGMVARRSTGFYLVSARRSQWAYSLAACGFTLNCMLFDTFALPAPGAPSSCGGLNTVVAGRGRGGVKLARTFGLLDSGRARIMRLASIVFGGALLIWTATIIEQMRQTEAAEERPWGASADAERMQTLVKQGFRLRLGEILYRIRNPFLCVAAPPERRG